MSKLKYAARSLLELLLTLGVGLVPVASGLAVMVYQLEHKLNENASVSAREAVFVIDRVLDNLLNAASDTLIHAGKPCASVIDAMKARTTNDSRISSLMLTRNNKGYCSTLPPPYPTLQPATVPEPNVRLNFTSPSTPNGVVVEYRLEDGSSGVVATAYGLELRSALYGFQEDLIMLLEFDDKYIWARGDSREPTRPSQSEFFQSARSVKHGYTLKAGYPTGHTAQEIHHSLLGTLPSLALVGVLTAAMAYWGIHRKRHKTRATPALNTRRGRASS